MIRLFKKLYWRYYLRKALERYAVDQYPIIRYSLVIWLAREGENRFLVLPWERFWKEVLNKYFEIAISTKGLKEILN